MLRPVVPALALIASAACASPQAESPPSNYSGLETAPVELHTDKTAYAPLEAGVLFLDNTSADQLTFGPCPLWEQLVESEWVEPAWAKNTVCPALAIIVQPGEEIQLSFETPKESGTYRLRLVLTLLRPPESEPQWLTQVSNTFTVGP